MAMLVKLCGENRQRAIDRDGGVFYSVRNCGCDLSTNNPSWKTASSSFKKKKRERECFFSATMDRVQGKKDIERTCSGFSALLAALYDHRRLIGVEN